MIERDLLIAMAEIAGVFVGFGALISVTRRDRIEREQLVQIRAVVTIGLIVMVTGLVPIGLDQYGVTGHSLWLVSSLLFLLLNLAVIILSLRRQDSRQMALGNVRSTPAMALFFWLLLELPVQLPLVLIVFAVHPALDPAFYLTALVFSLFEAAFVLAQLVYSQVSQ
jgi:hypothetical protein